MQVILLAASGQLGGAERMVLEVVRALSTLGVESSVLALQPGPLLEAALREGACAAEASVPPPSLAILGDMGRSKAAVAVGLLRAAVPLPLFVRRLSRRVHRQGADLIHSHGIKTHILAALMPRRAPVVWHVHDYVSLRPASSALLGRLARRCDLVIAVSHSVALDTRQWLPESVPVVVLHNTVDTDRFAPAGIVADLDALAGLPPAPPGTLRVGLAATFAKWKGHEVFLRALAAVTRHDVRGYVIGGPVYQTGDSQWSTGQLRDLIADLGLQDRVGLTGFLSDMPAAYRALDIVVHASTRPEPFGLVIPEAMACGRLVLATRSGGASELFDHDVQAVGVGVADVPSMSAALASLLADPDRRAAVAGRARAHVVARFGRQRFAVALADALAQITPSLALVQSGPSERLADS
jgi:glycosyltransferase involved in cell wall biosynthesis